jgi:hypothetical protein
MKRMFVEQAERVAFYKGWRSALEAVNKLIKDYETDPQTQRNNTIESFLCLELILLENRPPIENADEHVASLRREWNKWKKWLADGKPNVYDTSGGVTERQSR